MMSKCKARSHSLVGLAAVTLDRRSVISPSESGAISRTQELEKSRSVDQPGSVLFDNIFSPGRCRHRVVCRADILEFLSPWNLGPFTVHLEE